MIKSYNEMEQQKIITNTLRGHVVLLLATPQDIITLVRCQTNQIINTLGAIFPLHLRTFNEINATLEC